MAKKNITSNIASVLPGAVLILLMAGALTYGGQKAVAEATKPKAVVVKTVTVTKTEEPSATTDPASTGDTKATAASASTTSSSTTVAAPATPTATTNSFVYLRPTASTSRTALQGLQAGTVVQYSVKSTGLWQQVTVNGVTGYVYKKWLTY